MTDPKLPAISFGTDGECGIPFRTDKDGKAIQDNISLSLSDEQLQVRFADEIRLRIAKKSQDAWLEYIKTHRSNYPDYSMSELAMAGVQWRQNWIIENLCNQVAHTSIVLIDLLGVMGDLRKLSKAKDVEECSAILDEIMQRPEFQKQAG